VKALGLSLVLSIGLAYGSLVTWLFMGAPGSHALDGGLEPALWLTGDERGVDGARDMIGGDR
jgi:hypothetical protein